MKLLILLAVFIAFAFAINYSIDEHERLIEFVGEVSTANGFENLWLERRRLLRNELQYWRFIENEPSLNL